MKEINSRDNPKIKNIIKLSADKKLRKAQNAFVCEGIVNLKEAVASNVRIFEVYTTCNYADYVETLENCEKFIVTDKLMEAMSDVKTPQGVIFVCEKLREKPLEKGAVLAVENLRDSGNMGTILRTAEGLGVKNIVLLGECVEVHNPKTVRASMGSIFRNVPTKMSFEELQNWAKKNNMPIYATNLSPKATDIREVSLNNSVVIIGNEAQGVTKSVLEKADGHIIIPIKSAQSFNASIASAIVLWEMAR